VPQAPQFWLSLLVTVQMPPQLVEPGTQVRPQVPPEQTWPAGQTVPQVPQLWLSVWGETQTPAQRSPVGGRQAAAQAAPEQSWPDGHAVPQAPQFCGSLLRAAQMEVVPVPHTV
jgi:hypothetical protein